ncbi:hypothetical protein AB0N05_28330 [Nocardia sp. NPDC051030]|uniref:hypothetical protein n=1 Tax=Nocardia sp. NPDC051030 TaxID=3155162 RepID=UPI00343B3814
MRGSILLDRSKRGLLTTGKAAKSFRDALRLDPDNAVAAHNLALSRMRDGRLGSAARGFLHAAAMDPKLATVVRRNVRVVLLTCLNILFLTYSRNGGRL